MSTCRPSRRDLEAVIAHLRSEVRRHRHEIERLREAAQPLIHHAPARERFAFIDRLRDRFSVKRLCRVTVTDRGSFYGRVRAQVRRGERAYDGGNGEGHIGDTESICAAHEAVVAVGGGVAVLGDARPRSANAGSVAR